MLKEKYSLCLLLHAMVDADQGLELVRAQREVTLVRLSLCLLGHPLYEGLK